MTLAARFRGMWQHAGGVGFAKTHESAGRISRRFHGGQLDFEDGSVAEFWGFKLERLALKAKSSFLLC